MVPFIKVMAVDQAERLTHPDGSVTADIVQKQCVLVRIDSEPDLRPSSLNDHDIVANAHIPNLYVFAYTYWIYEFTYIGSRQAETMPEQIARNEKQLGAILRRARRQAGLTQSGVGKTIYLRQGTVSRLEAGKPAIQLRTVMQALAALDLELVVRARTEWNPADIENIS